MLVDHLAELALLAAEKDVGGGEEADGYEDGSSNGALGGAVLLTGVLLTCSTVLATEALVEDVALGRVEERAGGGGHHEERPAGWDDGELEDNGARVAPPAGVEANVVAPEGIVDFLPPMRTGLSAPGAWR